MCSRKAAQLLGNSPRTIAYCVQRLEAEGLAGLADVNRPGRPCRLDQEQIFQIEKALRKSPLGLGLSVNLWNAKTLSAYIKQQFRIPLRVRQRQRLFRQLGFQLGKPRSKIGDLDPSKKEVFKKNSKARKG